jgi:hypothetical protein
VVPVLVAATRPDRCAQAERGLLKRTWGENAIGNVGIGAAFGLITFAVLAAGCCWRSPPGSVGCAGGAGRDRVRDRVLLLGVYQAALSGIYRRCCTATRVARNSGAVSGRAAGARVESQGLIAGGASIAACGQRRKRSAASMRPPSNGSTWRWCRSRRRSSQCTASAISSAAGTGERVAREQGLLVASLLRFPPTAPRRERSR